MWDKTSQVRKYKLQLLRKLVHYGAKRCYFIIEFSWSWYDIDNGFGYLPYVLKNELFIVHQSNFFVFVGQATREDIFKKWLGGDHRLLNRMHCITSQSSFFYE